MVCLARLKWQSGLALEAEQTKEAVLQFGGGRILYQRLAVVKVRPLRTGRRSHRNLLGLRMIAVAALRRAK
jgi:hypothetical protein